MNTNPTKQSYTELQKAYDYFNRALFSGKLPHCLITLQRHNKARGYFSPQRFGNNKSFTDEIAMNPVHFKDRSTEGILSTLVHEMCHLWQQHLGEPPRRCYHDREWAAQMKEVGLQPSTTGEVGGKETGQSCSHYVIKGGRFQVACEKLLATGLKISWHDRAGEMGGAKKKKSTPNTRAKYTCGGCDLNAWARHGASLRCEDCDETMEAA